MADQAFGDSTHVNVMLAVDSSGNAGSNAEVAVVIPVAVVMLVAVVLLVAVIML